MLLRVLYARYFEATLARVVSGAVIAISLCLLAIIFLTAGAGGSAVGIHLGADFGGFYTVGVVQNEVAADRLYDEVLHDHILHREVPGIREGERLPFGHAPFVAALFRLLAFLPYAWAYALWLLISGATYFAAIAIAFAATGTLRVQERITGGLLALSFPPFILEAWIGGQLSAIGALAVAVALRCSRNRRPIAAGGALSLLFYKPPLLLLVMPVLVIKREWRALAGVAFGAAALTGVSILTATTAGATAFVSRMLSMGGQGGSTSPDFRTFKYIDLPAFLSSIGVPTALVIPAAIALAVPALVLLTVAALRVTRQRSGAAVLLLAATVCLTPVLNIYGPIYDAAIVVPALIVAADAVRQYWPGEWERLIRLLAILYLAGLIASPLAAVGIHIMTPVLAWIGVYFLILIIRTLPDSASPESPPA